MQALNEVHRAGPSPRMRSGLNEDTAVNLGSGEGLCSGWADDIRAERILPGSVRTDDQLSRSCIATSEGKIPPCSTMGVYNLSAHMLIAVV